MSYDFWVTYTEENSITAGPYPREYTTLIDGKSVYLAEHSDDELRALGLTPYMVVDSGYDPVAQISIGSSIAYDQGNAVVVATSNYLDRPVSDAVDEITGRINTYRDALLEGGWLFNGVRYDSDARSVINMAGTQTLINGGYNLPSNFVWRASDNTDHAFDNTMFFSFFIAAAEWRSAAFTVSWQHKARIAAMTSPHDVAAYDFTTGWLRGFDLTDSGLTPIF